MFARFQKPSSLLALMLFVSALMADLSSADAQQPAASSEDVAAWIEQLSANRFAERELAMQKLIDAGQTAIDPVVQAILAGQPETMDRGLNVLRQLGLSDDEKVEDAARAALNDLSAGDERRIASRAKNTLNYLNELRQDRAIAKIREFGGTVDEATINRFIGVLEVTTTYDVTLDEDWTGGVKGLKYIRWLPDLRMVTFRGKQVNNEWVKQLAGLDSLSIVELNRTSVDDAAMAEMKTLPSLRQLSVK